jgi:hypothetical protein
MMTDTISSVSAVTAMRRTISAAMFWFIVQIS